MGRKKFSGQAGIAAVLLAASSVVNAAYRFWVIPTGGSFGAPGVVSPSWSTTAGGAGGATVPGAADTANFTLNSTYDITFFTGLSNQFLDVRNGNVTFALGGTTYTLTDAHAMTIAGVAAQTARLTVLDGILGSDGPANALIGEVDGSTGFLTIGGNGQLGTAAARVNPWVGYNGTGTFTVQSNGQVFAG